MALEEKKKVKTNDKKTLLEKKKVKTNDKNIKIGKKKDAINDLNIKIGKKKDAINDLKEVKELESRNEVNRKLNGKVKKAKTWNTEQLTKMRQDKEDVTKKDGNTKERKG